MIYFPNYLKQAQISLLQNSSKQESLSRMNIPDRLLFSIKFATISQLFLRIQVFSISYPFWQTMLLYGKRDSQGGGGLF